MWCDLGDDQRIRCAPVNYITSQIESDLDLLRPEMFVVTHH